MAIRIMDSIKTANDTTDFPVSYAKDVWLNKDKTGATEDYPDLQTMYDNDELGNGGSSIQVNTMPIASVDELGKIYEFIGSTGTYVNGYFYECVSDGEPTPTYSWVQKNVQPNVNIVDTAIEIDSTWSSKKISADLADKQDFRIFNSLEEFNEKKGTSLTVVSGIDNMKDIVNAMSNGEMLIITTKYETGSEVYFGLTSSTGWTKMFTFIKSNGLCDVECRTTFPLTLKRVLNSDGVIGEWQQLATTDDIFRVGDRRNTIGWADLSNDVDIDGSSNFANNVGRIEGHNALIEVSNPSTSYQWPVTNSGDNNVFVDFGGAIQLFTDRVNNHLYVRFANSVDMSAWGEIATMDKVGDNIIVTPHTQIGAIYTINTDTLNRIEIDVAKSGYTCIGLLSLQDNHGSYTQFRGWYVENNKVVVHVLTGEEFSDYVILASLLYKKN